MKEKILALDLSSKCTGWAYFEAGKLIDYGTIAIEPKNSWAFRLSIFGEELERIIRKHSVDRVIIEDIYRGPNAMTFKVLAFFHGVAYKVVNDLLYIDPDLIGVLTTRSAIGKEAEVVCRTKEQAFFIMNSTLGLGLDFKDGNDIIDACALVYGYLFKTGQKPQRKLRFNRAKYEKIGEKKDGPLQNTRIKEKCLKRGMKKSITKVSKKVSPRCKSRKP
jgi:Holliday junction resolvasome RuvABC endonuclease subunit